MAKTKPREQDTIERPVSAPKLPRLPKSVGTAIRAALSKKAADIVVLDLRKGGAFTDYFIICTGENVRQTAAIVDAIREALKGELGERPTLAEGTRTSEWMLLDYFNFVVHVFSRECRAFYGLEKLWGNATRIDVSETAPATGD